MSNLSIAACVLFFEKVEQTIECIGSLLPSGITIYILNNKSSQWARNKLGEVCARHHQVKLFDSDENLGVGVGRNYLISHTTEDWLLFVDSDIVLKTPDWLRKVTSHTFESKDIEVFIPKLFNVHENRFDTPDVVTVEDNRIILNLPADNVSNSFPGGAAFVNRKLFDRAGMYDDGMFVGFEDLELSIRCMLGGNPVRAMIISDIELIHDHRQAREIEDKRAVLTRYDMSSIEKSFKRIAEKYPDFCFEHKWRSWVMEQMKKLLPKEDLGFTMTRSINDVLNSFVLKTKQNIQLAIDALLPIERIIVMDKQPHVSILSSVYNCSSYIGQTIRSVLNQTYENWEWVIVDDGSTDGTGDMIRDLNDKRIRYLFQEHVASQHIAKNFNKALMMCNGDLVAVIDGDDYWPEDKLQVQVKSFDDPSVILSYGESYLVNHEGKKIGYIGLPDNLSAANNNPIGSVLNILLVENSCCIVHTMLRKDALLRIGGFLEVTGMGQDFPTWVRLSLEGRFSAIPVCLGYYRKHASSSSIMRNRETAFNDEIRFFEQFIGRFKEQLNCLGFHYDNEALRKHWEEIKMYIPYNSALYMLMFGSFKDARSEFRKFLKRAPSIKNNLIYFLIVLSSYLRTDLVNPFVYYKEKAKALKKHFYSHTRWISEDFFKSSSIVKEQQ